MSKDPLLGEPNNRNPWLKMASHPMLRPPFQRNLTVALTAIFSIFAMVLLVGCGDQRGRFSTSGGSSRSFSSNLGFITILDGYNNNPSTEADKVEQHLLYLVFLCPGAPSGNSDDYGQYVTTLTYTWRGAAGNTVVAVHWDRQADDIALEKQNFHREKGNVFVIRIAGDGKTVCQQLTSLGPNADFRQVLEHARQQLPHDELISRLTLKATP
jgi:hypothetical protein